jgi:hypothetical protein
MVLTTNQSRSTKNINLIYFFNSSTNSKHIQIQDQTSQRKIKEEGLVKLVKEA